MLLYRTGCWLLIASGVFFAAACGDDDGAPTPAPSEGAATTFRVEGAGMELTFANGTEVSVQAYGDALPQRGDIIVFVSPTTGSARRFIKRIIGGPGDRVVIAPGGVVEVNGEPLVEPYAKGITECPQLCAWVVPPTDALRLPGFSPLLAEAPRSAFDESACRENGCYFVLGDNRQNSSDSRMGWLVPAQNIAGWVEEP
jgi:signal peptidase I